MDEPFVSLDETTATRLRAALLALWRKRPATVLFVTHDSREAIGLGERIIVFSGSPARVVADIPVTLSDADRLKPAVVEAFRQEKLCGVDGGISFDDISTARGAPPRYINGTGGNANS
jgi:ABC-type nitrate/sulfonate/bicarbonate transport system ATPase subunit